MAQQEVTDRLLNIIRRIKLNSMTGLLTVRRGEGIFSQQELNGRRPALPYETSNRPASIEEGTITFLNGKMVEAKTGRHSGSDAFNYLSTWGKCLYSFTQFNADSTANLASGNKSINVNTPITQAPSAHSTSPYPYTNQPDIARNAGQKYGPLSPAQRIPFRLKQTQQGMLILDKMGLSRAHRQLFLLIDDQRTIKDLARLMNASEQEIESRLEDLEKIAIVKWSHTQVPNVRPFPKTEK